ncbi:MAG: ParM/StbA family protein [Clostridium sp.]
MNRSIFLGVDNGNKCTKSSDGFLIETGLVKMEEEPIIKKNVLKYKDSYYILGQDRISVQLNKTMNDDAFLMTLGAIGYRLQQEEFENENKPISIILGTGLPLVHYGKHKEKFREYFVRDNIEFEYNQKKYNVNIVDNRVYPQSYAAFITEYSSYKDVPVLNLIDVGGFTIDILSIHKGRLIVNSCHSLMTGVITLISDIQQELLKININLTESQIEDAIKDEEILVFDESVTEIIRKKAQIYVTKMIDQIIEKGFELRNVTIFTGGGSELLKDLIIKDSRLKYVEFLKDSSFSNSKGYLKLLQQEFKGK